VQLEHKNGDKAENMAQIQSFVQTAVRQNVDVIVFPECGLTGYWFLRHLDRQALLDLAEPCFDGPACQAIQALARQHAMTIGIGLVERDAEERLYNTYVVALPDGTMHKHRKIHMFISPHLTCGDSYTVFDTPYGWKMGILICYDNNIIENVRMTALLGADLLLAPHQTGGCASRSPHAMKPIDPRLWSERHENPAAIEAEILGQKGREWLMRWLPARAHDNGLFLAFSNGIGVDDGEVRTGNAMLLDPYGRIVAESRKAEADLVVADLDPTLLEACTGRRWMRTRRPELYGLLTQPTGREIETRRSRFEEEPTS
jgi:predicted amidohydrolase